MSHPQVPTYVVDDIGNVVGGNSSPNEDRRLPRRIAQSAAPSQTVPLPMSLSRPRQWHFTVQDNPLEPLPATELLKIRRHVMYDYMRANNGDPRAKRGRGKGGAPKTATSTVQSSVSLDLRVEFGVQPTQDQPMISRETDLQKVSSLGQSYMRRPADTDSQATMPPPGQGMSTEDPKHLETGISPLRSSLAPTKHEFIIAKLKWSCARCFECPAIPEQWVPAIMSSDVAFWSIAYLSIAHDDAMSRWTASRSGATESLQELSARASVIRMIHQKLEAGKVDDGLIIAVIQILSADTISGKTECIAIHAQGLHGLIKRRTIDALGLDGLLARVVVICIYMICVGSGQLPKAPYYHYANSVETEPPSAGRWHEFPIYANTFAAIRSEGWSWEYNPLVHLLELIQQASDAAAIIYGLDITVLNQSIAQARTTLNWARDSILGFAASALTTKDEAVLEVVRLAACIHVEALYNCLPYSEAGKLVEQTQPMIVQFAEALERTDIDDLWRARRGVLLWSIMIMHAAMMPMDQKGQRDCFFAIRFVAAVGVRCSTRQTFEQPISTLGMLKRFVLYQDTLRRGRSKLEASSLC